MLLGLFLIPESPRWLVRNKKDEKDSQGFSWHLHSDRFEFVKVEKPMQAKVGKEKEFESALQKLRGKDFDISQEAAEIQVCTPVLSLDS